MSNYISEPELNAVKGLMHYLNENLRPLDGFMGVDVRLTDSNGEALGTVYYKADEPGAGYVLEFPS
jgi:hypothetical protein